VTDESPKILQDPLVVHISNNTKKHYTLMYRSMEEMQIILPGHRKLFKVGEAGVGTNYEKSSTRHVAVHGS